MDALSLVTMTDLTKTVLLATILFDGLLWAFVYARPRITVLYTLLLCYLVGVLAWAFSVLAILQLHSQLATKLSFASALVLATTKYYFVVAFPRDQLPTQLYTYFPLIPASLLFILSFFDDTMFFTATVPEGYYVVLDNGPYALHYSLTVTYLLVSPLIILWYKYRDPAHPPIVRHQIKYLFVGMAFFFIIGLFTNSILPVMFSIYYFNGLGPSLALIMIAFMAFIINRYDFLRLRLVLQRGLIYSVLILLIFTFYVLVLYVLGLLFQKTAADHALLSAALTTIVGTFSFVRLEQYFKKITDQIFFKDTYDYSKTVEDLSMTLDHTLELDVIIPHTTETIKNAFRVESAFVTLDKLGQQNMDDKAAISLPLQSFDKVIGYLNIGPKKSGDVFTSTDRQLINTLTHQVNVAIGRALLYQDVLRHTQQLEVKVAERTRELEAAYTHHRRITQEISHRLQSPLTVLKSEFERLQDEQGWSDRKLRTLEKVIDDLSDFVYDFLHLAELESGTSDWPAEPVNITMLLSELIEYVTIVAQQKGITIKADVAPQLYIHAHGKRLTELFQGVIGNSIKYIGEDNPKRITVVAKRVEASVVVTIADTGVGIPADELAHVFTRFYRTSHTYHIPGSGLGLAIAQVIVERFGGEISIMSTLGVETVCTVSFPAISPPHD